MAIITPLILLMKNYRSVKKCMTPGLIFNLFLTASFVMCRKFPPICKNLPTMVEDGCKFDWRESEGLMFLVCIVMLKNRLASSLQQMVETFIMFAKLLNLMMFYRLDPVYSFFYALLCLSSMWFFPEPFPDGPEDILYFSDKTMKETIEEDSRVVWIIEFYTTWSPQCHTVAPVFSSLSNQYATNFLRFGKLDAGRFPEFAKKHGINASTMSKQLPTIVVYKNGKPNDWRPMIGSNKKFLKYSFTEENIIRDFGFNKLHEESLHKEKKCKKLKAN